jgi:hypothetical protein
MGGLPARESLKIVTTRVDDTRCWAYPSAVRTLCGRAGFSLLRGSGQVGRHPRRPDCATCEQVLKAWVEERLERDPLSEIKPPSCAAKTKKGTACERYPLPGTSYCYSHRQAA